jgi:hypothetical protein
MEQTDVSLVVSWEMSNQSNNPHQLLQYLLRVPQRVLEMTVKRASVPVTRTPLSRPESVERPAAIATVQQLAYIPRPVPAPTMQACIAAGRSEEVVNARHLAGQCYYCGADTAKPDNVNTKWHNWGTCPVRMEDESATQTARVTPPTRTGRRPETQAATNQRRDSRGNMDQYHGQSQDWNQDRRAASREREIRYYPATPRETRQQPPVDHYTESRGRPVSRDPPYGRDPRGDQNRWGHAPPSNRAQFREQPEPAYGRDQRAHPDRWGRETSTGRQDFHQQRGNSATRQEWQNQRGNSVTRAGYSDGYPPNRQGLPPPNRATPWQNERGNSATRAGYSEPGYPPNRQGPTPSNRAQHETPATLGSARDSSGPRDFDRGNTRARNLTPTRNARDTSQTRYEARRGGPSDPPFKGLSPMNNAPTNQDPRSGLTTAPSAAVNMTTLIDMDSPTGAPQHLPSEEVTQYDTRCPDSGNGWG